MTTETTPLGVRPFSRASAVHARSSSRFDADVDPEWTIGGRPNGGYLLAMAGRAATWGCKHDHVVAASAHFAHAPEPGPVLIQTEPLRTGRWTSQVQARIEQEGRLCVGVLLTVSHLADATAPYWDARVPAAAQVPREDCEPVVARMPDGTRVAIMDQVEVRLDSRSRQFVSGLPTGQGELRGWLMLPGDEQFDPTSLLYAVDAFPPATLDIEFAGWVPTLELTVYVRAMPVPGPVWVLQRAQLIEARRVDESCFVWDAAGRLVAQGTQLAGIRLG